MRPHTPGFTPGSTADDDPVRARIHGRVYLRPGWIYNELVSKLAMGHSLRQRKEPP